MLAEKFERNASKYWDRFYKEHQDGFFRDRHYLHREFPALEEGAPTILEVLNHRQHLSDQLCLS